MVLFAGKCQHGAVGPTCIECYRLALADAQDELKAKELQKDILLQNSKDWQLMAESAERLNGELLALLKKIDVVFESPTIHESDSGFAPTLEIPYEVAAGVKGALSNTSLNRNDVVPTRLAGPTECGAWTQWGQCIAERPCKVHG